MAKDEINVPIALGAFRDKRQIMLCKVIIYTPGLTKPEPLSALGSHQGGGGGLNLCVRSTPLRESSNGLTFHLQLNATRVPETDPVCWANSRKCYTQTEAVRSWPFAQKTKGPFWDLYIYTQ